MFLLVFPAAFIVLVIMGHLLGIGAAPSCRVYPHQRKPSTPEERKQLFKKLGVQYPSSLVFPPAVQALTNLQQEDLHDYAWQRAHYDLVSGLYGSYLAQNYMAPVLLQWVSDEVGYGVCAAQDIFTHGCIMEYAGQVVAQLEGTTWSWRYPAAGLRHSQYLYRIDARKWGNESRFSNPSDYPNVGATLVYHGGIWHLVYIALRYIKRGAALLIHYGDGYWKHSNKVPLQSTPVKAAIA